MTNISGSSPCGGGDFSMYGFGGNSLDGHSVFCEVIRGRADRNQWTIEKPFFGAPYGMSCVGKAANPSIMLGRSIFSKVGNREMAMKTGTVAEYSIGAGSKAAGMRIRCRSLRFEGVPRVQE